MENIPVINIMGVNIAAINMDKLIDYTVNNIENIKGKYICVANVHTTVMAHDDADYLRIQNGSILTIPDGGPLSSLGRRRGYSSMERTTGPDYMKEIFKLEDQFKGIDIVGMYSPPFRELGDHEDEEIIKMINQTNPDFVWVGLGAPKQEKWMYNHKNRINGLMVGVGAGFDYFAGNIKRAPEWMQKNNLEWLYRLIQEPRRLFKRYFATNTKFIWHAVIRGE